jgi:hypothetical protein
MHAELTHQQRSRTRRHTNEVLQDTKLGLLDLCPQTGNLTLDARIDLLDLELLLTTFIPNPAFLEVEIEPDTRLRASDFFPQTLLELLYVGHESVVLGFHECEIVLLV